MNGEMDLKRYFDSLRVYYADINGVDLVNVDQVGPLGDAPLHYAVRMGNIDAIRLLLHSGADINIKGDIGNTALHDAARLCKGDVVELLLTMGADASIENEFCERALDVARTNGCDEVTSLLSRDK